MAASTRLDSPSCTGSLACITTNMATSASSSPAMALLVTQNRSSSVSPSWASESMMKPVEGVSRASASNPAACQDRPA